MFMYGTDSATVEWRQKASALAEEVIAPGAAEHDAEGKCPVGLFGPLGGQGFLGLCVDTDHGGSGQGPAAFCAVTEELAQRCGSAAMIYVMHVTAQQMIAASTTLAARDEVLGDIAAGKHITTLAFSERGSRSQFWAPVSKLVPASPEGSAPSAAAGNGYTTDAFKSWVTAAHHAHTYVSSAQAPGASSPAESTLYLVPRERDGVKIQSSFDGLGLRGNDSTPVAFEGVKIAAGDLLTENGKGADGMLQVVLPWFSIGTAAMAHGLCQASVKATAAHLSGTGFEHTGSQLRDLPQLRARIAEMSLLTEQSRALLGHTLSMMGASDPATPLYVLLSRKSALQAATAVTDLAMKACGGAAFSRHLGIERFFRDARAGWVMAPTVDHLNDFIGRVLTGLPLFD